jgi:hypothetical protein
VVRDAERLTPPGPDSDGWIQLRVRLDYPDEVPSKLLALGGFGEVIGPPDIRQAVAALARQMAARYGPEQPN